MKTLTAILLLTATVLGQEGFDTAGEKGLLPEGIADVTDIKKVQLLRVEALKDCMQVLNDLMASGTHSMGQLLKLYYETHVELALAQLDTTDVKQERLDYIQAALKGAIQIWRIAKDRSGVGAEGSSPLDEARTRADVYKLRVMWLKEKANAEP